MIQSSHVILTLDAPPGSHRGIFETITTSDFPQPKWGAYPVMAGLVPAIHENTESTNEILRQSQALNAGSVARSRVDGRDKPGHDEKQKRTPCL